MVRRKPRGKGLGHPEGCPWSRENELDRTNDPLMEASSIAIAFG